MKARILFSLILIAGALSAKAGNEGAQAAPQAPVTVLAEYFESGGLFVPPGAVASKSYQVLTNGDVQLVIWTRGEDAPTVRALKRLSTEELIHLESLVESIQPGEMV